MSNVPEPPGGLQSGFAHWIAEASAREGQSDQLGEGDDPDGDGAVNLLEYASGTDPFDAASAPAIQPAVLEEAGEKWAVLKFAQRTDTASLRYRVEESTDLKQWAPVKDVMEVSRGPVPGKPLDQVSVAIWPPLPVKAPYFLRLQVEQNQGPPPP